MENFTNFNLSMLLLTASVSALLTWSIIKTVGWHSRWTADASHGVQKIHKGHVPRIGGLAILLALIFGMYLATDNSLLILCIFVSFPAFLIGFIEDLTKVIKPLYRLAVCLLCGFVAWFYDIAAQSTGFYVIDILLENPVISVFVTVLAVAALANAINMLDGLNGLSGGYCFFIAIIIGSFAQCYQVYDLSVASFALAAAIFGFLVFNWPMGSVFLGDGGAYLLGSMLALLAMVLAERVEDISQTFTLVLLAYPAWDLGMSMLRRLFGKGSMTQADHNHLHSRAYRYLKASKSTLSDRKANSIASLAIVLCTLAITFSALFISVQFAHWPVAEGLLILIQFLIFSLIYKYLRTS